MKIKNLEDLKEVCKLFKEQLSKSYNYIHNDFDGAIEFINDYLDRCKCCGKIVYYDSLTDGVCEECQEGFNFDTNYEPDAYDEYVDRKMCE